MERKKLGLLGKGLGFILGLSAGGCGLDVNSTPEQEPPETIVENVQVRVYKLELMEDDIVLTRNYMPCGLNIFKGEKPNTSHKVFKDENGRTAPFDTDFYCDKPKEDGSFACHTIISPSEKTKLQVYDGEWAIETMVIDGVCKRKTNYDVELFEGKSNGTLTDITDNHEDRISELEDAINSNGMNNGNTCPADELSDPFCDTNGNVSQTRTSYDSVDGICEPSDKDEIIQQKPANFTSEPFCDANGDLAVSETNYSCADGEIVNGSNLRIYQQKPSSVHEVTCDANGNSVKTTTNYDCADGGFVPTKTIAIEECAYGCSAGTCTSPEPLENLLHADFVRADGTIIPQGNTETVQFGEATNYRAVLFVPESARDRVEIIGFTIEDIVGNNECFTLSENYSAPNQIGTGYEMTGGIIVTENEICHNSLSTPQASFEVYDKATGKTYDGTSGNEQPFVGIVNVKSN